MTATTTSRIIRSIISYCEQNSLVRRQTNRLFVCRFVCRRVPPSSANLSLMSGTCENILNRNRYIPPRGVMVTDGQTNPSLSNQFLRLRHHLKERSCGWLMNERVDDHRTRERTCKPVFDNA